MDIFSNNPSGQLITKCQNAFLQAFDISEITVYFLIYLPPILSLRSMEPTLNIDKFGYLQNLILNLNDMLKAGRITENDLENINTLAKVLTELDLLEEASLVRLFTVNFRILQNKPRPVCHCFYTIKKIKCKTCNNFGNYLFWEVVNAGFREDLRKSILNKEICVSPKCYFCGTETGIETPFFYCDPDRGEYLIYFPWDDEEAFEQIRAQTVNYLQNLPGFEEHVTSIAFYEGIFEPWCGPYPDTVLMFRILSLESFHEIINEQIFYGTVTLNPFWNLIDYDLKYNSAYDEFAAKRYIKASRIFAECFLGDQIHTDWLLGISSSLRALGELDKAKIIDEMTTKLEVELRKHHIIQDIRFGKPKRPDSPIIYEIWKNGLPSEWGFDDLISIVRDISKR